MAQKINVNVTVEQLTKYGFRDAEGYVSWSEKLSNSDRVCIVPGVRLEAEYYISDRGTRYLNKIFKVSDQTPVTDVNPPKEAKVEAEKSVKVDVERAKKFTPSFNKEKAPDNSMSKDEWAAKDRRISRQGCIQVAVQVVSDFEEAAKLADKMLEYVNGDK